MITGKNTEDAKTPAQRFYPANHAGSFHRFVEDKDETLSRAPYIGGGVHKNKRQAIHGYPGADHKICEDALISFALDSSYSELPFEVRQLASALALHKMHTLYGKKRAGSMAAIAIVWREDAEGKYKIDVASVGDSEVVLVINSKGHFTCRPLNIVHQKDSFYTRSLGNFAESRRGKISNDCDFIPHEHPIKEGEDADVLVTCDALRECYIPTTELIEKAFNKVIKGSSSTPDVLTKKLTDYGREYNSFDDCSIADIKLHRMPKVVSHGKPSVEVVAVFDGYGCGQGLYEGKSVEKNPVSNESANHFSLELNKALAALDVLHKKFVTASEYHEKDEKELEDTFKIIFEDTRIPPFNPKQGNKYTVNLNKLLEWKAAFDNKLTPKKFEEKRAAEKLATEKKARKAAYKKNLASFLQETHQTVFDKKDADHFKVTSEMTMEELRTKAKELHKNMIPMVSSNPVFFKWRSHDNLHERTCLKAATVKELEAAVRQAQQKYQRVDFGFFRSWRSKNLEKAAELFAGAEQKTPHDFFKKIREYLEKGEGSWHRDSFKTFLVEELRAISFMSLDKWSKYLCNKPKSSNTKQL